MFPLPIWPGYDRPDESRRSRSLQSQLDNSIPRIFRSQGFTAFSDLFEVEFRWPIETAPHVNDMTERMLCLVKVAMREFRHGLFKFGHPNASIGKAGSQPQEI